MPDLMDDSKLLALRRMEANWENDGLDELRRVRKCEGPAGKPWSSKIERFVRRIEHERSGDGLNPTATIGDEH